MQLATQLPTPQPVPSPTLAHRRQRVGKVHIRHGAPRAAAVAVLALRVRGCGREGRGRGGRSVWVQYGSCLIGACKCPCTHAQDHWAARSLTIQHIRVGGDDVSAAQAPAVAAVARAAAAERHAASASRGHRLRCALRQLQRRWPAGVQRGDGHSARAPAAAAAAAAGVGAKQGGRGSTLAGLGRHACQPSQCSWGERSLRNERRERRCPPAGAAAQAGAPRWCALDSRARRPAAAGPPVVRAQRLAGGEGEAALLVGRWHVKAELGHIGCCCCCGRACRLACWRRAAGRHLLLERRWHQGAACRHRAFARRHAGCCTRCRCCRCCHSLGCCCCCHGLGCCCCNGRLLLGHHIDDLLRCGAHGWVGLQHCSQQRHKGSGAVRHVNCLRAALSPSF